MHHSIMETTVLKTLKQTCENCSRPFTPKRSDARYCSGSCRAAASRARTSAARRPAPRAPRRLAAVPDFERPLEPWDPPSESLKVTLTTEPCPACGERLMADPRGIWRACWSCRCPVTPGAIHAVYPQGHQAEARQVRSQREHDLEAIEVARRKGLMLMQLGQLADDKRLHPASLPVVDWFRNQVKDARHNSRLDELAALLPEAGIRRRHFWQSDPAAIEASYYDDDDEDQDYEPDSQSDRQPRHLAIAAAPAPAQPSTDREPTTWADAIASCGWRLSSVIGGCQIISNTGQLCGADTARRIAGGWVCARHHAAVCEVIYAVRRQP